MFTVPHCKTKVLILALLLLGVRAQKTYDPNETSEDERQYIIETLAGEALKQYAKETGCELELSNNLYQTYNLAPFVELLYKNGSESDEGVYYDVWNSDLVQDQINTIQEGALDLSGDKPDAPNFNKRVLMDMNIMCYKTQEDLGQTPLYKSYPFVSDPNITVKFKYFASVRVANTDNTGSNYEFDNPNFVYRWNTFVYYPMTTIYTLSRFDADNRLEIYVMQAFGNKVNNQYAPDQLVLNPVTEAATTNPLTPSILTPDGVTFGFIRLSQYLIVPSNGAAQIVTDNLYNAYMLIPRSAAPWLYEQYENGVKTNASPSSSSNMLMATAAVIACLGIWLNAALLN